MKLIKKLLVAALLAVLPTSVFAVAQITEPDTIFYGQVINRTSGQLNLITAGKLVWTVLRPDGKQITLNATLTPLNNGQFSYRLSVPHQALAYGLTVADSTVPLGSTPLTCGLLTITVDGTPASVLAPGTTSFAVGAGLRAATYRLDLELFNPLADTAGDGIPDWWKAKYGVTDPNAINADGWSNLQKFQNGGSPNQDNRYPTLGSTEYWAYADGRSEIPFTAIDSDSVATNIIYQLTSLPASGTFYLRNATNDIALGLNDAFTQNDVNQGKLIFVHGGSNTFSGPASFNLNLRDENPAHATNYLVWLNVYRPAYATSATQAAQLAAAAPFGFSDISGLTFGEQQMLINYYLGRDRNFVLADASRSASAKTLRAATVATNAELSHVLMGGSAADRLVGGGAGDILIGGRGNDTLRGNGGADLFIISDVNSGNDTIEDFSPADGDALDIARVLTGTSGQLTNFVQLTTSGTNSILAINFAGSGSGYTNMTMTLLGKQYSSADLRTLSDGGYLLTGNKALSPVISIAATIPAASQNGPVAGQFTLTRTGPTGAALSVNLTISGSAINGTSYQLIPATVDFAAGQRTVVLPVNPYSTTATLSQIVQIAVAAGSGYGLGTASSAQVSIEPLLPQISIEALEPMALKSDLSPGVFLVTRGGIVDRSVLVRLTISGTASSSTDYNSVSTFVNFSANQTTALITITPKSTANLTGGAKYVQVAITNNTAYTVMQPSSARVYIVEQLLTGADWQQRYFAGATQDWSTFANLDTGNTGIRNLSRYAFGLNATNPVATNGLPFYQIVNDRLSVTFRRPLAVTDLDYVVQVSDDLVHWSSLPNDVEPFTPAGANTNAIEMYSYRSKATVHGGQTKQFMRVVLQPR